MSARLPRIALVVFVLGLGLHNLVMAELWDAGVRGSSLDVVAAWKDVLLAAALLVAILGARSLPVRLWADRLALAYGAHRRPLLAPAAELAWRPGDAARPALRRATRSDSRRRVFPRTAARADAVRLASCLARPDRARGGAHGLRARGRLSRPAAVVARLGGAGLVRGAARAPTTRGCRDCPRTGCSTPATRRTRSGGWGRRSSARSRPRTCS